MDAAVHALADRRTVLRLPVVVRGDRARAEVRPLAHVGVADVREVRDFGRLADVRVLHLHEGPHLRARTQHRSRAQIRERANCRAVLEHAVDDV